jgi:diguanylate cyclase
MAREYKSSLALEAIMPVLDDYVVWYGKLMGAYFEGRPLKDAPPVSFTDWLLKANLSKNVMDRALRLHSGLRDSAKAFIFKYGMKDGLPLKEYNELSHHYEEFIHFIRRLELDHVKETSGYDERTGLRAVQMMHDDIAQEMERLSRRGHPFCLALIKINNYQEGWRDNLDLTAPMVRRIADVARDSLRSFDDAYYLGEEYFLLCLKHSDMPGTQAAMTRLSSMIDHAHIPHPGDPLAEISISSVVFEPMQGHDIDEVIGNMKKDLEGINAKGTVVYFRELSPLQRYMQQMDKTK